MVIRGIVNDDNTIIGVILLKNGVKVEKVSVFYCIFVGRNDNTEWILLIGRDIVLVAVVLLFPRKCLGDSLRVIKDEGSVGHQLNCVTKLLVRDVGGFYLL